MQTLMKLVKSELMTDSFFWVCTVKSRYKTSPDWKRL